MTTARRRQLRSLEPRSQRARGQPRRPSSGQEDFLNLMITQLKNQDPIKPLDAARSWASSRSSAPSRASQDLQTKFDTLSSSLVSNQALQAASLVGKDALVESSKAPLYPGGERRRRHRRAAPRRAARPSRFATRRYQVVAHIELGAQPAGLARFEWNGITDDGAHGSRRRLQHGRARISRARSPSAATTARQRARRQRRARQGRLHGRRWPASAKCRSVESDEIGN